MNITPTTATNPSATAIVGALSVAESVHHEHAKILNATHGHHDQHQQQHALHQSGNSNLMWPEADDTSIERIDASFTLPDSVSSACPGGERLWRGDNLI